MLINILLLQLTLKLVDVYKRQVIDRVETAVEALNVSVNEFGYVNPAYMLSIYEPDITCLLYTSRCV